MTTGRIAVAGGGPAGIFAAIAAARAAPGTEILLFEKSPQLLSKVLISGGGRCNVTHACFDPREFAAHYPRGGRPLIGPLHRFGPRETAAWFGASGVQLKTEPDGRMFPVTDDARTIVDALLREATRADVRLTTRCGVESAERVPDGFALRLTGGARLQCSRLLLALGGCRASSSGGLAESLGHTIEPPVPSLFSFHADARCWKALPGVAVEHAAVSVPGTRLSATGPVLLTHTGLSGPAILRLSAWGARLLHERGYRFPLAVHWLPDLRPEAIVARLDALRTQHPARLVANTPLSPLPARLWEQLVAAAGIPPDGRWSALTRGATSSLAAGLARTEIPITGKSLNKEEFVTCGGVRLREVDFRTMESRLCPGLFFAGEFLDIDGLTGGFNFQAAWTTGWIAGCALASKGPA